MKTGLLPTLVPAVLLLGVGLWLGSCFGPEAPANVIEGAPDTVLVNNPVLAGMLEGLEIENEGLRARLEGVQNRRPRVIVRSDTVLAQCPAVTYTAAAVDGAGSLYLGRLDRVEGGFRPTLRGDIDVSRCDDGFSIGPSGVTCDPAQLGHLAIYGAIQGRRSFTTGALAVEAETGLTWTPSYRSTLQLHIGVTTSGSGAVILRGEKALELF